MVSHLEGKDCTRDYRKLTEDSGLSELEKKMLDEWINTVPARILEDMWPAPLAD